MFEEDDDLLGFEFHSSSYHQSIRIDIKSVDLTYNPGSIVDWNNQRTHYIQFFEVNKGFNKILLPSPIRVLKHWFIAIINPPIIFYYDSTLSSNYYDYQYYYHDFSSLNHFHSIWGRVLFNPILNQQYFFSDLKLSYLFLKSGTFFYDLKVLNYSKTIESTTIKIDQCKIILKIFIHLKIEHFLSF